MKTIGEGIERTAVLDLEASDENTQPASSWRGRVFSLLTRVCSEERQNACLNACGMGLGVCIGLALWVGVIGAAYFALMQVGSLILERRFENFHDLSSRTWVYEPLVGALFFNCLCIIWAVAYSCERRQQRSDVC